jgi:hypothetical protein
MRIGIVSTTDTSSRPSGLQPADLAIQTDENPRFLCTQSLQYILNLTGRSENLTLVTGKDQDQDDMFR